MSQYLIVDVDSWLTHKGNEKPYLDVAIPSVLESVFCALVGAFGKLPDERIEVSWWKDLPRVLLDSCPYQIRINAQNRNWCQYVYQFSHKLCHVMTNYNRNKVHRHCWFEESLCEMASLFVLHELSESWKPNPPENVKGAAEFAPNHAIYCESAVLQYMTPEEYNNILSIHLPEWFALKLKDMEADSYLRDRNVVVALALLEHFQSAPSLWADCGYLNYWNVHENETFEDYLNSWEKCLKCNDSDSVRVPALVRKMFYE